MGVACKLWCASGRTKTSVWLVTVCLLFMLVLLGMFSSHKPRNGKGKHMPTLGGLSFSLRGREEYLTA